MKDKIENRNYCVYVHTSPSGKKIRWTNWK